MEGSPFASWTEQTLAGIRMLAGVPDDVLLELGRRAKWARHAVGERLFTGERARDWLFFLTGGAVQIRMTSGDKTGEKRDYGPGVCIGLRRALAKQCRSYVTLVTVPATAGWVHRDDLIDMMASSEDLGRAVVRSCATRLRDPLRVPDDNYDLEDRVIAGLIVAAGHNRRANGMATLSVLPDPAVWAALIGVAASAVQRSLARLERQGCIRIVAQERMYVNVDRLQELLEAHRERRDGKSS